MVQQVELYTADAVVTGTWPPGPDLRDALEAADSVQVERPAWTPLDPSDTSERQPDPLPIDDILAVAGDTDPRLAIHANWHDVIIDAGPYRLTGLLPVLPGFDPGRALTRPGSTFLLIKDVTLELIGRPDEGELEREFMLVNRYGVERVASDLILGFFFPAAQLETLGGTPAG